MSEEHIIRHCAPTLAGIKTGSLFTCEYLTKEALMQDIRVLNKRFRKKGLRILPLRFSEKRALIYLFRPNKLSRDLNDAVAINLLKPHGYNIGSCEKCVVHLIKRLHLESNFPHEIGLFLGYPPEDVCGFIENRAGCCKLAGDWKVYGDEVLAKKRFAQYKKCSELYFRLWSNGKDIELLTVAG